MAPIWAYVVLALAIVTMSSGGVWFALMTETPPLMQACWRLSMTTVMQCFGVAYELHANKATFDEAFWLRYRQSIPLLLSIGAGLAAYFGSWGWSVAHTSLLDSLLLVCTTPLLIVIVMTLRWLYRRFFPNRRQASVRLHQSTSAKETDAILGSTPPVSLFEAIICPAVALPPTWMEVCGAFVGFSGIIVLLASTPEVHSASHQVTLAGNLSSLIGALVFIVYLEGGLICRKWMPLFLYSLSVTSVAAFDLAVASLLFEPSTSILGLGPSALFGYFGDSQLFLLSFGAAFVAGFFGHACMNIAVVHVSTLLLAVCALWEPLIGSYMGYIAGVQDMPDSMTLIAAPLLLGGALLVTLGGRQEYSTMIASEGDV
ncbi:unnamed protein product [Aphanomyces euteiches]|uniref:EamA domain-containing protein n=1 Tax=Aphanomyces euteiches TaxID=100861 RepID=A0A6G0XR69_9STRA|nr:hypothetical protein Ae201684_002102 [Aphanomyces euteiches]KAH9132614.1 hypothetical protein AeRB84_021051 [Aphanomyces euteiches]KAH9145229.1 hypothetical protein AeRB84_010862 [Aphanomyces euteiches]KAH9147676.1 hypothetical protein AeRB84_008740 [Aphanomyces euteiches]KAH9147707.1 hypothetical protein AeRB84_008771 [Aphanomyces euteiches]